MKLIMFFACEASKDGKDFGWELNYRYKEIVQLLKNDFDAHIMFASDVVSFNPPEFYGELMQKKLLNDGIDLRRIQIVNKYVTNTAREIDVVEAFIRIFYMNYDLYAASSDYHIPRIIKLWKRRHGRIVKPLPLAVPHNWYIRKRMLREYPKTLLMYFPAPAQDKLWHIMRRLKIV